MKPSQFVVVSRPWQLKLEHASNYASKNPFSSKYDITSSAMAHGEAQVPSCCRISIWEKKFTIHSSAHKLKCSINLQTHAGSGKEVDGYADQLNTGHTLHKDGSSEEFSDTKPKYIHMALIVSDQLLNHALQSPWLNNSNTWIHSLYTDNSERITSMLNGEMPPEGWI